MNPYEVRKRGLAVAVESERQRWLARHGRAPTHNQVSEARRRLEQAGETVTAESLEAMEEYLEETKD